MRSRTLVGLPAAVSLRDAVCAEPVFGAKLATIMPKANIETAMPGGRNRGGRDTFIHIVYYALLYNTLRFTDRYDRTFPTLFQPRRRQAEKIIRELLVIIAVAVLSAGAAGTGSAA